MWSAPRPKRKYVVRKETSRKGTSWSTSSGSRVSYIVCIERYESTGTSGTHSLRDDDVVGKAFYVMDFLVGRVCEDAELRKWTAGDRATLVADMVRVLAELHNQDFEKLGLEKSRKERTWKNVSSRRGVDSSRGIPSIEANVHKHDKARLVLDYNEKMRTLIRRLQIASRKLENVRHSFTVTTESEILLRPEDPRILAVLDWEISTLGHPICDLAYVVRFRRVILNSLTRTLSQTDT